MARSRLLSGASTPILGKAASAGAGIGSIQYYSADPGAGFLKCDGRPFAPAAYPALVAATPRAVNAKTTSGLFAGTQNQSGKVAAFGNGKWVMRMATLGDPCLHSVNAYDWSSVSPGAGQARSNAIAFGNGLFVSVGGGFYVETSTDGTAWTYIGVNGADTSRIMNCVAFGGGRWVIGRDNGYLATSTDLVTWNDVALGINSSVVSIDFANGLFVCILANGQIYSSPVSPAWGNRAALGVAATSIKYIAGTYYVGTGNGAILYSANLSLAAASWGQVAPSLNGATLGGTYYTIDKDDTLFYVGYNKGILTTPDMVTFYDLALPAPLTGIAVPKFCLADNKLVAGSTVGTSGVSVVLSKFSCPSIAEGTLANGQPAIPYMKAA